MFNPAPVSNEGYSLAFASETPRTNYLLGGLTLGTAYDSNILLTNGPAVSDVKYSVWPSISLAQSRSRLGWNLTYDPGFKFYQNNPSLTGTDHYLEFGLEYRLTPHITLSVTNSFQKTSDLLNLSEQTASASGAGATPVPNSSILPPATARISNLGNAEITYQFGSNAMVGARGALSGLWYPHLTNLSGLFDSTGQSGEAFYAHRLSAMHYIGATYGFQRLLTHPGQAETQTQSMLLFYTLYLPPGLAVSVFAGPEHSDTHGGGLSLLHEWSPAEGGSLAWHGEHISFTASYARRTSGGGGLSGAVRSNRADASVRWQLSKSLTTGLGSSYSTSSILDPQLSLGVGGGHTWSGTASLQHPLGKGFDIQIGYTHLHQNYSSVTVISNAPDQNNCWVAFSYQFERGLGR